MKRIVVFLLLLACALCAVAQTQVSLTVSNPVALAGALVTLNATVSGTPTSAMPTSTIPTGTITFEDGTTPFGQATLSSSLGLATGDFFTSSLSAGSYQIVAQYSGDANFKAAASAAVSIAIEAFSITPSATTLSLTQGQSGNIVYTAADAASLTTAVQFGCMPPANTFTTCTFNPAAVTGNGQTALTITTTGATKASAHRQDLFATGGRALACLLLGFVPFGFRFRRRIGSAALLPAISLIVLLSGIVTGCSSSSTSLNPLAATPTPPGTQVFEVITSTTAVSQTVGQDTWITVNVLPAS
jgi:hypothetical protein